MDILVKVRAIPMRHPVLVPGDRGTNAGLLNKERFVKGGEVWSVNRLGDLQKLRVSIGS